MSGTEENQIVNDGRILGFPVAGLPSAATPFLQFDFANKIFIWVAAPASFDGKHTSLSDKEIVGTIDHADDSIPAPKLKSSSVTTPKINDLAVTTAKIASDAVIEDKLGAGAVSLTKMKDELANAGLFIGYDGGGNVAAVAAPAGGLEVIEDYQATVAEGTKTFSFTAIDFEDVSQLILVIDGSPTATFQLQMQYDSEINTYHNMGRSIPWTDGGSPQINIIDSTDAFSILSGSIGANAPFTNEIKITLSKNASINEPFANIVTTYANTQVVLGSVLGNNDTSDISSIKIFTSTSTWKIGTRMTLYKKNR